MNARFANPLDFFFMGFHPLKLKFEQHRSAISRKLRQIERRADAGLVASELGIGFELCLKPVIHNFGTARFIATVKLWLQR